MSLKHNPFDNSYKGALVRRKKVFENPTPEELAIKALPEAVAEIAVEESAGHSATPVPSAPLDTDVVHSQLLIGEARQESRLDKTYGKPPVKHTENGREIYGSSEAQTYGKSSENIRIPSVERNLRNTKPTDTPTDIVRKIDGKPTEISSLVGLQRRVFFSLAQQAKEFGFSDDYGNRITPPINGNIFAQQSLQKPYKQAKDVIYELKVSGFLAVFKVKNGRGGFVQYLLRKALYQAFLLSENLLKPTENGLETHGKPPGKPTDTPTETIPCSSSNLNLSNTTTTDPTKSVSDNAIFWLSVPKNLDGLVSVKQLREFVRQGLVSEDVLQTSLDGFAFDLEKGAVKAKNGNPVAILIGAIKGGGYISQSYMAELRAALAEVEKTRAELHKIQAENVAEQLRVEFETFREKFPEDAAKIKPSGKFLQSFEPGSVGYRMWLDAFRVNRAAQNPAVGDAAAKENSSLNP